MVDEFGPVCTNPACADEMARLNARIDQLDNDNADLNGRVRDLGDQLVAEPVG